MVKVSLEIISGKGKLHESAEWDVVLDDDSQIEMDTVVVPDHCGEDLTLGSYVDAYLRHGEIAFPGQGYEVVIGVEQDA